MLKLLYVFLVPNRSVVAGEDDERVFADAQSVEGREDAAYGPVGLPYKVAVEPASLAPRRESAGSQGVCGGARATYMKNGFSERCS